MERTPFITVPAALASLGLALVASPALAEGVPAGTLIENTATASFENGGTPQTVESNTVTIRVDELLDVAVATLDGGPVTLDDAAVLTFSVTNTGNGPERFVLTANPTVTGNDFDGTVDSLAIDTNGNGVYDAGVDTLLANGATSPSIDADGALTVFVLVSSPGGLTDGDTSQLRLTAAAATGTGQPGRVFPGAGVNGSDAVVGSSGADDDDLGRLIAALATVTLTKSASVTNAFGTDEAVPGATIRYTIVASATGSGTIRGLRITDPFPTGTTYTPGTLRLGNTTLTDAADTDRGETDATGITVRVGSLATGGSRTVTFDVTID